MSQSLTSDDASTTPVTEIRGDHAASGVGALQGDSTDWCQNQTWGPMEGWEMNEWMIERTNKLTAVFTAPKGWPLAGAFHVVAVFVLVQSAAETNRFLNNVRYSHQLEATYLPALACHGIRDNPKLRRLSLPPSQESSIVVKNRALF